MNKVQEYIYNLIPTRRQSASGWYIFNCKSCLRYGEKRNDTKHRGNLKFTETGFVYQCFNCHHTFGWSVGNHMSKKFRMFLEDFGLDYTEINKILTLIDEENVTENNVTKEEKKERIIRSIPEGYKSIMESMCSNEQSETLRKVFSYITSRNERLLTWDNLMWKDGLNSFLIPCREYGKVVGYTIRNIDPNIKTKYYHYVPNGYLYNMDSMLKDRKYNILVEGELDALSIDGVGLLENKFTTDKLKHLMELKGDSEIIILPDRDKAGMEIVKQVLDKNLPFSISFPNWNKEIKDCEEAVRKYGRLYTVYDIIKNRTTDKAKIMMEMKW